MADLGGEPVYAPSATDHPPCALTFSFSACLVTSMIVVSGRLEAIAVVQAPDRS